jgi:hypothetical protein
MPATATDRLNGLTTSVAVKPPCVTVTSESITLAGLQTIGGVPVVENDRVLVKDQDDPKDNGIYSVSTGDWTRVPDFDGNRDAVRGTLVLVRSASADGAIYELVTPNPVVFGTSEITFELREDPATTYEQSQLEIDAGITPTNTHYIWGHALRYGSANNASRLQATINSGHDAYWPAAEYTLGAIALTLRSHLRIDGASIEATKLTYTGNADAINGAGCARLSLKNFSVYTTATAANGIRLGGGSDGETAARQVCIENVGLSGNTSASNTGAGLLLHGGGVGDPYSGSLVCTLLNTLGYKYGVKGVGVDANATWTTVSLIQCKLSGRDAGIIAGSAGIYFDALTIGVGSKCDGGAIEGYATGVECLDGSFGITVNADIENCTNAFAVGATFNGEINNTGVGGVFYQQRSFSSAAVYRLYILASSMITETQRGPKHVMGNVQEEDFGWYRGGSLIDSTGTTVRHFGAHTSTNDDLEAPERNYIDFAGWHMTRGAAAPTSGTWARGDVCWNTGVAAAGSPGWICTTAGSPGTWKALANVAA